MVQAARSGVQNIAESSEDSGTSKKIELKLTQVARGSLEELKKTRLLDFLKTGLLDCMKTRLHEDATNHEFRVSVS